MTIISFVSSLSCWGNSQEQRGTMQEIVHTRNSHPGFFSKYKYDWIILVILIVTEITIQDNTISFWYVWLYAVVFPYLVIVCFYLKRRCVYDLNYAILGLIYAISITFIIIDSIRLATGRPRPNFYWRCFPDGKELYDTLGNVVCHGTAISFAGLGFLSLYLSGKIKVFNGEGHVAKLCIVVFPLLVACFTGISCVDDYWNHWSDIFAGALIGFIVALFCYRQFYPNPNHEEGWVPYAYFKAAQELEVSVSSQNRNALRTMSLQIDSTCIENMESSIPTAPTPR